MWHTECNLCGRTDKATELIQKFAGGCHELILAMKESDFENHITSMVKERLETDLALEDEVLRNWGEVTAREYVFDRQHREVSVVCTSFTIRTGNSDSH